MNLIKLNLRRATVAAAVTGSMLALSGNVSAQATAEDTFTATTELQAGLEVNCDGGVVDFGTISVPSGYEGGDTVTLASLDEATAETDGNLIVAGGSSLGCAVTGIQDTASAVLAGAGGSWNDADTLTGATLTHATEEDTLSADITLGSTSEIGDGTIYIGGSLTVASDVAMGVYESEAITLTLSE